jgi:hypothetical protein
MMQLARNLCKRRKQNVALLASAAAMAIPAIVARAGSTGTATTISISGSTALKNFIESPGLTLLNPAGSNAFIVLTPTLSNGYGTPVTYGPQSSPGTYSFTGISTFQLAPLSYGQTVSTGSTQVASALRIEYHESGSVEGILELANDQIGIQTPVSYIQTEINRDPNSGNAVWVNQQQVGGVGGTISVGQTFNGYYLGPMYGATGSTTNGFIALGDTNNPSPTFTTTGYNAAPGTGAGDFYTQGGQNAVQLAVLDVVPGSTLSNDAYLATNTANPVPWLSKPGQYGYGDGDSLLPQGGLGVAGGKVNLQPSTSLNMTTNMVNPRTGTNFASGPWNSAGLGNVTSQELAVTATLFVANDGTGLSRLDQTDAQWLQLTGRLQNGAAFNVTTRDVNSGTHNTAANNTGIDPSWAVGVNDNGNGNASNVIPQLSIGPEMKFSNKTAGGAQLRPTVQNNRMALGTLSVGDANGVFNTNKSYSLRALEYSQGTNQYGTSNPYVLVGVTNIMTGAYAIFQNEQFVTVKAPTSSYAAASTSTWDAAQAGIPTNNYGTVIPSDGAQLAVQGDDPTYDVAQFEDNILNSIQSFEQGNTNSLQTLNSTYGLISKGFILPGLMYVNHSNYVDGASLVAVPTNANTATLQSFFVSSYASDFNASDPNTMFGAETSGNFTDKYGGASGSSGATTNLAEGSIPITFYNPDPNTPTDDGGNWLFGNFNQNGIRDYDSVVVQGLQALAALEATGAGNSAFSGGADSTLVTTNSFAVTLLPGITNTYQLPAALRNMTNAYGGIGATKGDLIVMGDYDGRGTFDGKDLYDLAVGASLADGPSTGNVPSATNGLTPGHDYITLHTNLATGYTVVNATGGSTTYTTEAYGDAIRRAVLYKNTALDYLNTYATVQMRSEARAVLEGSNVPSGATVVGTDAYTGLTEYTYDPNGVYAFNKSDVLRAGTVDVNDAVDVDKFSTNTYSSLTGTYISNTYTSQAAQLSATIQAPVTGAIEQANLVLMQQIDGESAITSADVNVVNQAMTGPGNANWYGYNLQKTGPSTIVWGRTAGTDAFGSNTYVTVYPGASFEVSNGTFDIAGNVDPFTDDHPSGPTAGNHVALTIDSGGVVNLQQNQGVVTVSGLTINNLNEGSKFNIGNGAVVIAYTNGVSPVSTIRSYIQSGFNNFNWNGPGITSSVAATDAATGEPYGGNSAIGYADNNDLGRTDIPANSVLVRFTYYGDADLNGKVDLNDFDDWLYGYTGGLDAEGGVSWSVGDFDYDNHVTLDDFDLWLGSYTAGLGSLNTLDHAIDVSTLSSSQKSELLGIISSVPEPASFSLLAAGTIGLLGRRRRKVAKKD